MDTVEEIKSRCNIIDVIGRVVSLKRTGNNYKGLCPFHNEKTPSFVVSESKQIYSCFGCGAAGDVISFVQRQYNLDFPEAVQRLAEEYGIEIKNAPYKTHEKEALFEINREAARFFYHAFTQTENPARVYMDKREIEPGILKKFGVGYADGEWDSLYKHFQRLGTKTDLLLNLGLIAESKGKYYDKFRDRVIFPIINSGGKVIGFGGRAISDGTPKYLNSAESAVFLKKNNLFGLNLTRQDINKENRVFLVEGYMDVISLYQAGVRNVAASLGTAFTENQARMLKRYTDHVVISYDADEAGQAAALRGLDILHREGLKAKVLQVSDGKDPDEFIKKNGKNAFLALAENALPFADYKLSIVLKKHDINSTEGKLDFIKEAVQVLRTLSPAAAEEYIKVIAKQTKISESAITLEYNGNNTKQMAAPSAPDKRIVRDENAKMNELERNFIKLFLTNSGYLPRVEQYKRAFISRSGLVIFEAAMRIYRKGEEIDLGELTDALEEKEAAALQELLDNVHLAGKEEEIFIDCVRTLELFELSAKGEELVLLLSMAEGTESDQKIEELTIELIRVQQEIQRRKK